MSQRTELKVSAPRPINQPTALPAYNTLPLQPTLSSQNSNINGAVNAINPIPNSSNGTSITTTTTTSPTGAPPYSLLASSTLNSGFTLTPTTTLPPNYSSAAGAPITSATACMSVLNWMSYVLNRLNEMQWKHIGTEGGSGRALYEMTNPNAIIDEIFQR